MKESCVFMLFCNNCGNNLSENDKFCKKCGTPQLIPTTSLPASPAPAPLPYHQPLSAPYNAPGSKILEITGIFLIVCGVANLLILMCDFIIINLASIFDDYPLFELTAVHIILAIIYTAVLVYVGFKGVDEYQNVTDKASLKFIKWIWWGMFALGGLLMWVYDGSPALYLIWFIIPIELLYIIGLEKNIKASISN